MDYGTESDNYAQLFLENFGQESPELSKLFKSDFGQETPDWFLVKSPSPVSGAGLTHPAHLDQGVTGASHGATPGLTSSPRVPKITRVGPTQVNNTPSPTDPQTHINRLTAHGIRVTDNMPVHYTPEQRAGAIHNVANAVDFMHGHFPGLADATRKHQMEYNFTGPQIEQHAPGEYSIVHGSYDESSPHAKINIHTAGEQTLWHEHLHFLDHALKGRVYYATDYEDHPLNKLAESLKNTQAHHNMLMSDPDAREYLTGTQTIDNQKHHNYLTDNREVLARFFNQYMHHAATTTGGLRVAEAPSTTEEQYTPEDLVKHGQLFRDALISHGWTKSFTEYLDNLDKGIKPISSWGRGSFKISSTEHSTSATPAPAAPATPKPAPTAVPTAAPAPTTPAPITPDVPKNVGEATGNLHDDLAQEYATRADPYRSMGDKSDAHHGIATHMLTHNPVSLEDHIQARIAMRPGSSYKRLHDQLSGLSDLDQHKDLLRTFDDHWIGSVNSADPEHVIANRVNAGRVFGLNSWENKPDYISAVAWRKGMRLADDPHFQKAHGSYLRSMYAHTQSELAKRGLGSVALIRGVHKIANPDIMQSIRDQYKDGDLAAGHMDTNLAPLSSFTLSPKVASDYGGITPKYGQSSATLNMVGHVPASRILSLWNTGYGYGDHHEVVALGGPARMHWATHSYDGDVMHDWLHQKQRGLIKSMNIPTVDIDNSVENLEWLQPPDIKSKYHNKSGKLDKAIRVNRVSDKPDAGFKPTRYAKPAATIQQTPEPPARVHGVPALSRPKSAPDLKPHLESMIINHAPDLFTQKRSYDPTKSQTANLRLRGTKIHAQRAEQALQPHIKPGYTPRILGTGSEAMAVDLGDKVARVTPTRQPDRAPHPWMLQPIDKGTTGLLHWEVLPKAETYNSEKYFDPSSDDYAHRVIGDMDSLRDQMGEHGYEWWDDQRSNFGWYNGKPVVIDPGSVARAVPEETSKSFGEYLSKALEETHQQKPAPGSHRQTRTPRSYNIPRKITRPGVRGSTLWWIDPKTGTVRYGPKPKPKEQRDDPPGDVKNYLQSEQPWSFMSAYSDKRDEQANALAHVKLGQQLQGAGYKVTPSKGYYTDTKTGQLREEPSYFVMGMGTKDAIPVGQEFGQESILTNHGMFDMASRTLAPISYKRVVNGDLPKNYPQSVVLTPGEHVTIIIDTGQARPLS